MIKKLQLSNFRAFERLTLSLRQTNVILGPNNAGKSTLLNALRGAANMLRYAMQKSPVLIEQAEEQHRGYWIEPGQFDLPAENLKYELREVETTLGVTFRDGARLSAIWPPNSDDATERGAFFKLVDSKGVQPWRPIDVRKTFPRLGVIPLLAPVEHEESLLEESTVRRNLSGRLASRHLRNQLWLLKRDEGLEDFLVFCDEWLPDIRLDELRLSGSSVDLFYSERGRLREISWAGDGIQVYLQLLLHIYRLRQHPVLILDEPDVYLHPDLQRRLLRLLESIGAQVILSTHSSEIAAEASPSSLVWIDKGHARAIRIKDDVALAAASRATGTRFNLRLARALQARLVLFVEGQDMTLLASLAQTVGAKALSTEADVAVVPLEGTSNIIKLQGFAWVIEQFLGGTVEGFALIDRDYRTDEDIAALVKALEQAAVTTHVWERKELENYLLVHGAISRLSGMEESLVITTIDQITMEFHDHVLGQMVTEMQRRAKSIHISQIVKECSAQLSLQWDNPGARLELAPGKEVLAAMNLKLQESEEYRPISARALAKEIRADELATELRDVLLTIEGMIHKPT